MGRNFLFFEPPISGAGPIVTLLRNADGRWKRPEPRQATTPTPILEASGRDGVKKNTVRIHYGGIVDPTSHPMLAGAHSFCIERPIRNEMLQQKDN